MKLKLLILVLALQSAWILGTTVMQEYALAHGTSVLLETRPVDPRDLLRGDYVILSYRIGDIPQALFSPAVPAAPPPAQAVYVALEKRGQFHVVARAATIPFPAGPNQVLLKGWVDGWSGDAKAPVRVAYGLERFYVREGTGNPRGKLTVEGIVTRSGQASVKQVFVDGRPYAEAMKSAE